ncbi:hypothetical protein SKAU_G00003700 [Synaphobranchus kaupii]|uniref:Uncharacterized protein n=1 Tax=Synaphobranchus kaupii TaxID=118154 RepID=A0A9Q1GAD1_SYNKA|nr:hypothetical protein SKAU_G00003700 [Synaphobranchus kaupii]
MPKGWGGAGQGQGERGQPDHGRNAVSAQPTAAGGFEAWLRALLSGDEGAAGSTPAPVLALCSRASPPPCVVKPEPACSARPSKSVTSQ